MHISYNQHAFTDLVGIVVPGAIWSHLCTQHGVSRLVRVCQWCADYGCRGLWFLSHRSAWYIYYALMQRLSWIDISVKVAKNHDTSSATNNVTPSISEYNHHTTLVQYHGALRLREQTLRGVHHVHTRPMYTILRSSAIFTVIAYYIGRKSRYFISNKQRETINFNYHATLV